jgi:K+-sensing histidine kinase KdpD
MTNPNNTVDFSLVLASSVHDMKNSIGMLVASLEAFIDEYPPENEKQTKHFNTLHYEASRINAELVQLLTIYRMQNDHLPLRVDQHYVIDVLEDQLARNHSLLDSRGIHPRLECDDSLEWYFDADLIGGVVQNVIVNCSRYTRSEILVSAKVENDFLRIVVADDGNGYPPSMLESPSLFMEGGDVSKGGTHLGLYFTEQIARLHKQKNRVGYIRLENGAPLGGSCFNLFLP